MQKFIMDGINKLFICKSGVTEFDVQLDLYSEWKEELLLADNLKYEQAMRTVGGDPISETRNLGDTYFLINGWKIRPHEADHRLSIIGNLFTEDGTSATVPTIGDYNVLAEMTTSNLVDSTIAQLDITNLQYLIESNRQSHRGYGTIYYLDPINGLDTYNGLSPEQAFQTFSYALQNVTDGTSDVVFVINNSNDQYTISENLIINKDNVSIRGPGGSIIWNAANNNTGTIVIDASYVTIDGFVLENTYDQDIIIVKKGNALIQNNVFDTGNAHAVNVWQGRRHLIRDNHIHDCAGGIHIEGYATHAPHAVRIERNVIHDTKKYAVEIKGTVDDTVLEANSIYHNPTGICIKSGCAFTIIKDDNIIANNSVIDICDQGTSTVIDIVEKGQLYVQGFKDSVWTHTGGTSGIRFENLLTELLSMANGRIVNSSSGVFDFYDRDNTNIVFTLVENGLERNRQ